MKRTLKRTRMPLLVASLWFAIPMWVEACRHAGTEDTSSAAAVGWPDAEGIPISFESNLPATIAHEIFANLGLVAKTSNPDGHWQSIRDLPVTVKCQAVSAQETHCRLIYGGPEIKLKVAEVLLRIMAGNVYVARGCNGDKCDNPLKIWWRTSSRLEGGKPVHELEVCQIKGLEAGVGPGSIFTFKAETMESVTFRPIVHGFKAKISEFTRMVPAYDDQGAPKVDASGQPVMEPVPDYKVVEAFGGMGPFGPFPTANCQLSDDMLADKVTAVTAAEALISGRVPDSMLNQAPGRAVKFGIDVTNNLGAQTQGKGLSAHVRCQNAPDRIRCAATYAGAPISVPIPKYITGIFDGVMELLRPCTNPGCKPASQVDASFMAFTQDGLERLEFCSITGTELTTKMHFPWQEHLFGIPDVTGLKIAIDPGTASAAGDRRPTSTPALKKWVMGLGPLGSFPTRGCDFDQTR